MRRTTDDKTLERNYEQKWKFLIHEYETVKKKKHSHYRFVSDFYKAHGTNRQTFNKYYNRYLASHQPEDLFPRKRGPKWRTRRPDSDVESLVIQERLKGINRYEICAILRPILKERCPSFSGVYNIIRRAGYNRLTQPLKQERRKIIKERAGQLGHIDCHYLSKDLIVNESKRYYLVCVLDDATRLAWAEVVEDIKSLSVMFATLKCINLLSQEYQMKFEEVLTDNGSEFSSKNNTSNHPFERMLIELGVKHIYTRPYRPQTNGKVERFWKTLKEDLIEFTNFESMDHFKDELMQYLIYYNNLRPHQGINGQTPKQVNQQFLSTN